MSPSTTERIPARLHLLLALFLLLGLAACGEFAGQDPLAGGPVPGECDCDDVDDDDEGGEGGGDDDCDDDDGAGDDDDPHFLCEDDDAPSLAESKVMFYAVRGQARSANLWYHAASGETDSTELVRLELGPNSLLTHPDGSPVAAGDSVLITIEVLDQNQGIVWFEPAGLGFSASDPALLTFGYGETDDDVNGDGVVNQADEDLEAGFSLWRQESPVDPFSPVPSLVNQPAEQVSAEIDGFTRYAVAY